MKYGLLKYRANESNIGDYVQSLAAKRFLPNVDVLISREALDEVDFELAIILNGWFMHRPKKWPPSDSVKAKFVAFHMNDNVKNIMLTNKAVEYFKKREPIGCRDNFTKQALQEKGVDAYFSGCLTLTLERDKYTSSKKREGVVLCDILVHKKDKLPLKRVIRNPHKIFLKYLPAKIKEFKLALLRDKLVNKLIPEDILNKSVKVSNQNFKLKTEEEKFKEAKRLLKIYADAELVVTSRIHVALPCLAFGTPVIFIHPNRDNSRFSGIIELFHTFTIKQIQETPEEELKSLFIKASKGNKELFKELRGKLIQDLESYSFN